MDKRPQLWAPNHPFSASLLTLQGFFVAMHGARTFPHRWLIKLLLCRRLRRFPKEAALKVHCPLISEPTPSTNALFT